ncbi:MAG: class I SAM-dependent methyltransferase [Clostridia bacterium]|nr:class I SAM-dependent methyltransferase [Clostridia bacterium]
MNAAKNWKDYELLDTSDGMRLERWGTYTLIRPDPQVIWKNQKKHPKWNNADAVYHRSTGGGGSWQIRHLPEEWTVSYHDLTFKIKPMGFKHTGLFPEQAVNWDWFSDLIRKEKEQGKTVRVLNLFAYTGGATVAAAKAGASVVHVDAAKGMVAQAKENAALSGLSDAPIRYIVDDCKKFMEREIRRGNKYDAIIMDPPSYGRGPNGEVWKLEDSVGEFVELGTKVLSDNPLFVLINSYTTGLSPSAMAYILHLNMQKWGGVISADEIGIPVTQTGAVLPCGSSAYWKRT